jgi:hypothetical protein
MKENNIAKSTSRIFKILIETNIGKAEAKEDNCERMSRLNGRAPRSLS